jgi:hypothetical protein
VGVSVSLVEGRVFFSSVGRIPTRKPAVFLQQNQTAADTDKVLADLLFEQTTAPS